MDSPKVDNLKVRIEIAIADMIHYVTRYKKQLLSSSINQIEEQHIYNQISIIQPLLNVPLNSQQPPTEKAPPSFPPVRRDAYNKIVQTLQILSVLKSTLDNAKDIKIMMELGKNISNAFRAMMTDITPRNEPVVATILKFGFAKQPLADRLESWFLLSGAKIRKEKHPTSYDDLLTSFKQETSDATKQIEKDLDRTLNEGKLSETERTCLRNVLVSYSWINPSVGYCQSMNFICYQLLQATNNNQADSFFLLSTLVEEILPHDYYCNTLDAVIIDWCVFVDLLDILVPEIKAHLTTIGFFAEDMDHSFTTSWFLSLYVHILPKECVLRVWDCLFCEKNSEILLRAAVAILKLLEPKILALSDSFEFISLTKHVSTHMTFLSDDPERLIQTAYELHSQSLAEKIDELRKKHTRYRNTYKTPKIEILLLQAQPKPPTPHVSRRFTVEEPKIDNNELNEASMEVLREALYAAVARKVGATMTNGEMVGVAKLLADFQYVHVWLIGSTKAGKSSLINAITGADVPRNAWAPCTQEISYYDHKKLRFIDTKGVENWAYWKTELTAESLTSGPEYYPHVILFLHKCGSGAFPEYKEFLDFLKERYQEVPIFFVITNCALIDEKNLDEIQNEVDKITKPRNIQSIKVNSVGAKLPGGIEIQVSGINELLGLIYKKLKPDMVASLLISIGSKNLSFIDKVECFFSANLLKAYWKIAPQQARKGFSVWLKSNKSTKIFLGLNSRTPFSLEHHPYLPHQWVVSSLGSTLPSSPPIVDARNASQIVFPPSQSSSVVVGNYHIPPGISQYYFEITICVSEAIDYSNAQRSLAGDDNDGQVGMGLCTENDEENLILYQNTGDIIVGDQRIRTDRFSYADVIGCFLKKTISILPNEQNTAGGHPSGTSPNSSDSPKSPTPYDDDEAPQSIGGVLQETMMLLFVKNGVEVAKMKLVCKHERGSQSLKLVPVLRVKPFSEKIVIITNLGNQLFYYQHNYFNEE
eukprot:TRINITY_DN4480_c0_g1_i1.p1 TRINITY_DN4480_c0_g1~~TRINITY_DN4480_c0_g1_i1.p1  ORF type:complete len:987 (+),score=211.18 TRINITY_DN4480_c0_g1_i1:70-3030(+)